MKRLIALLLAMICLVGLTGCTFMEEMADMLYTTSEYRKFKSFADKHKAGMKKEKVLDELGYPDAYRDALGDYYSNRDENFQENLLEDDSAVWIYECHKLPDPAEPYRLKITFNIEGKSEHAELTLVPGG